MTSHPINIHTHRPTGVGIELQTTGIHPWKAAGAHAVELEPLPEHIRAIGEIGLDYSCGTEHSEQLRVLREQLVLAELHALPVVLHCVRAFEPLMDVLSSYNLPAVIFHGFIGSPIQAQRAVACGYFLSFGERTFRSPKTIEALRATPLDHLFCETDESPIAIEEVYARTALAKGIDMAELAAAIEKNYKRIFEHNDL